MSDILENIGVHVVCKHCAAEFDTRADLVADSQELLEEGCPGEHKECPARLFANLVDRAALRDLVDAWERVRGSVHAPAVDLELVSGPSGEQNFAPKPSPPNDSAEANEHSEISSTADPETITFTLGAASDVAADGPD